MNPACELNIDSLECQNWMSEVCYHCSQLLQGQQVELWDYWWPNDLPAPYNPMPYLLSAYECHKLKREVARRAEERAHPTESEKDELAWRLVLCCLLIFTIIGLLVFVTKLLCSTLKRIEKRTTDVEAQPLRVSYATSVTSQAETSWQEDCKKDAYGSRSSNTSNQSSKKKNAFRGPSIVVPVPRI